MKNDQNLMIGMALIAGAFWYTRQQRAGAMMRTASAPRSTALGAGSMPGSVGSGMAQVVGGLLGNLTAPKFGGGTQTGAPVTNSAMDQFPIMAGDGVLQNSIDAADPFGTFNPGFGSSLVDQLA